MNALTGILTFIIVSLLGAGGWLIYENDKLSKQKSLVQSQLIESQGAYQNLSEKLNLTESQKQELDQMLLTEKEQQQKLIADHQSQIKEINESLRQEKEEMSELHTQLVDELQNEITNREIKLREMNGRISLSLENKILFASGDYELSEKGIEVLGKVSDALDKSEDHIIRVEGHTDNVPLNGSGYMKSNWELSAARALSVVHALLQSQILDPDNIEAVAMGEFHPIADNANSEGRAENRRIEIYLSPKTKNIDKIDSQ